MILRLLCCCCLLLCACTHEEAKQPPSVSADSLTIRNDSAVTPLPLGEGLNLWQNMEQIEYCVPIPTDEYLPDHSLQTRGQFLFLKPNDSIASIQLAGLFRTDPSVSVEAYMAHTYSGEEESEGTLVSGKYLIDARSMFWAEGTWANLTGYRFLEITWLRTDEVILLSAVYPETDQEMWEKRRKIILSYDSFCH